MNEEQYKEFMLQQQAQSAARIAQLEELLVSFAQATRERFAANDRRTQELDEKFAALLDAQMRSEDVTAEMKREAKERGAELDRKIAALVDSQIRTEDRAAGADRRDEERAAGIDRRIAALFDSQGKTEEAIRKLAVTVDRHIVEGHNGRARPEG